MDPVKSHNSIKQVYSNEEKNVADNASDLEKNAVELEDKQHSSEYDTSSNEGNHKKYSFSWLKSKIPHFRLICHIITGCFFTAWWLSIIIQDKKRHKWLIPTILWGCIMKYQRLICGGIVTIGVMLLGAFVPTETPYSKREDRAVSFFGILVALFGLWLTSRDRARINWNAVIGGMLMQFIIALFVLRTKAGYDIFNFISTLARLLLGFAKDGVAFLTTTDISELGWFFFSVIPAVIFFVAFIHIWFYFGVIQWAIGKFAYFFFWALRVSGAEAIVTAASPFIGQGESAILVKDFLPYLTKAELHQIMCAGFATISGSVLVGYIGLGLNAQALVSSCVMSIPCSLAVSKLRYPETEEPLTAGKIVFPKREEGDHAPKNVLQAYSQGATLGLRIGGTLMVQCMCIIALVALINGLLTWFGNFWNIKELTLELMLSYLLYPVGFLLGPPRDEILTITKLIATKTIQNEFVAFSQLIADEPYNKMSDRGTLIATYALCGFANFGSIGINLGVLSTLCPNRGKDITQTIISAFITGAIATLISAAIAGMVIHDLTGFITRS